MRLKIDGPEVGEESRSLKEKLKDQIRAHQERGGKRKYQSDNDSTAEALYNAQDMLAYKRARFRADCAARAIRTAADAEKHMIRIAVARAEVVRQK